MLLLDLPRIDTEEANLLKMKAEQISLEETPTWAFSAVCLAFFVISATIDAGLHRLTKVEVINFYAFICLCLYTYIHFEAITEVF